MTRKMALAAAVLAAAGTAAAWQAGLITWLWFEVMTHMAP